MIYPLNDGIGSVSLVQHVGDDKSVVNAARVSFGGDNFEALNDKDIKLIKYLLKHQHGSPFEHNSLTFKITAPIFVIRQWQRHRVGVSFNEISGRYVEVKEQNYTPALFREQAKNNRQASITASENLNQEKAHELWQQAWQQAYRAYGDLLALGVTREQARGVLPLSLYSEFYFTCNIRSLLHFLGLRDHEGAQWETRQYAKALRQLAEPLFPNTFTAWQELHR